MKDFSWLFKRRVPGVVIVITVELIVLGALYGAIETGNIPKIILVGILALVAQYVIYSAWKDIRSGEQLHDDSDIPEEFRSDS
ncbi:MAG: hypothetical protein IKZ87_07330 [Actinomycetaceae bacterium]|nr:hypothetical protein [Actinomycetaceae bacterium]